MAPLQGVRTGQPGTAWMVRSAPPTVCGNRDQTPGHCRDPKERRPWGAEVEWRGKGVRGCRPSLGSAPHALHVLFPSSLATGRGYRLGAVRGAGLLRSSFTEAVFLHANP